MQVIRDPNAGMGGVTNALGGAIRGLLQGAIQRNQQSNLNNLFLSQGYAPEQAGALSQLNPQLLPVLLRSMGAASGAQRGMQKGVSPQNIQRRTIGLLGEGYSMEEASLLAHLEPQLLASYQKNRVGNEQLSEDALNYIASHKREAVRRSITPKQGTNPDLTQEALNYFVEEANGNKVKALKLAKKAGYKIPKELSKQLKKQQKAPPARSSMPMTYNQVPSGASLIMQAIQNNPDANQNALSLLSNLLRFR